MAGLIKISGWFFAIALCAVFFLCVGSAIHVRSAVAGGALDTEYGPCRMVKDYRSNPYVKNHIDNAMWRSITGLPTDGESGRAWRLRSMYTYLGMRLAYTDEERRELILPKLEVLPICERVLSNS